MLEDLNLHIGAGTIIDQSFALLERLGQGGFGEVWKARDESSGRHVAIKLLLDPSDDSDARFRREARALASLRHPGCVTPYRSGRCPDSKRLYLAMELVEGRGLGSWIASQPGMGEILSVASQLASALQATHALGITHRDIKPSNVLLTPEARVKLIDFGIARFGEPQAGNDLTATGDVLGSPGYMSPEQMRGLRGVGPKSDLYSFGVLLFTALEGRPPFEGATALEICMQHLTEPAPPVRRADCPPNLAALVHALLGKEPSQRPDISHVLHVLVELAGREPYPTIEPVSDDQKSIRPMLFLALVLVAAVFGGLLVLLKADAVDPVVRRPTTEPGTPFPLISASHDGDTADNGYTTDHGTEPTGTDVGTGADLDAPTGCGQSHPRSDSYRKVFSQGEEFHVWLPKRYNPQRRYPLLLLFQRSYYSQDEFFRRSGLKHRWRNGLDVIVVTRPSDKDANHNALGGKRIRPWRTVEQLRTAIATASERYCVDEARVIGVGHGKGAQDLLRFACELEFAAIALFSYAPREGEEMCALPSRTSSMRIIASLDEATPRAGGPGCRDIYSDEGKSPFVPLSEVDRRWQKDVVQCRDVKRSWEPDVDETECMSYSCGEAEDMRCEIVGGHNLRSPKNRGPLEEPVFDNCDEDQFIGYERFSKLVTEFFRKLDMID